MDNEIYEKTMERAMLTNKERAVLDALFNPHIDFELEEFNKQNNIAGLLTFRHIRRQALIKVAISFLTTHYGSREKNWIPR